MKYLLRIAACLLVSLAANGQINPNQLPALKLANLDSAKGTYVQVLNFPRLVSAVADCEVIEYTILFTVKDGESYGPFTNRTPMLTDEQKVVIKNLRNEKVRINISNITTRCGGQFIHPHSFNFYMGY